MIELFCIFSLARRALLLGSILIGNCFILRAQTDGKAGSPPDSPGPAHPAMENGASMDRELRILTQRLALTEAQRAQVKSLLAGQQQQIEALRRTIQNDPGASGSISDKLQTIRKDTETKIAALLSDDQKMEFAIWQNQRNAAMERRQQQNEMPPSLPDPIGGPTSMI